MNPPPELPARLLHFWKVSGAIRRPAVESEFLAFQQAIGHPPPPSLAWLLSKTNGMTADHNNTNIASIRQEDAFSMMNQTLKARTSRGYPDEVLVIGDNGSDDKFALWIPAGPDRSQVPVLAITEFSWNPTCVQLVAYDLLPFLWARHAFYEWMYAMNPGDEPCLPKSLLRSCGLPSPEDLGVRPSSEAHMAALLRQACSGLPIPPKGGWTEEALRTAFGGQP